MFTPQLRITHVMRIPSDALTKAAFQKALFVTMTTTVEMVRTNRLNVVSIFLNSQICLISRAVIEKTIFFHIYVFGHYSCFFFTCFSLKEFVKTAFIYTVN